MVDPRTACADRVRDASATILETATILEAHGVTEPVEALRRVAWQLSNIKSLILPERN